jgi:polyhydroxybutyrate depolymerase
MFTRAALAVALVLSIGAAAAAQGERDITLQTADGPRHAVVYAPGPGPHPTVIVLHGALGTAAEAARDTGFVEAARARGFTAVFADGLHRQWRDGRAGGPSGGPDDVAFLRALVGRLIADGTARGGRMYIAGISNGGMMSFTMACKAGDLFAGVGTVIANMPAGLDRCDLKPEPLVMINGVADPMVPYAGGQVGLRGGRGEVLGAERTATMFARVNGCGPARTEPLPHRELSDRTSVERISWTGCARGAPVTLYRVQGGGHAYPGRPPLAFGLLGASNRDLAPADIIMNAFAATPR